MCGPNSKWLGPARRLSLFGSPTGGQPRPGGGRSFAYDRPGYRNGAKLYNRHASHAATRRMLMLTAAVMAVTGIGRPL